VALTQELRRIAEAAVRYADTGEEVVGIVPAEPSSGARSYLCAFRGEGGETSWLVLDEEGKPVEDRVRIREVVSIAALVELAEETAGGGNLEELRSQLVALRLTENPAGIDEAEEAAIALEEAIGAASRVATPERLDAIGAATLRLERALGGAGSPFAVAMKQATATVDELTRDVETAYKVPLA
jgi:Xaa-Pro aminopeptidase